MKEQTPHTTLRTGRATIRLAGLLFLLVLAASCSKEPAPAPERPRSAQVTATVASFAVTTSPGVETVETIVFHDGKIRFPDERTTWRLLDIEAEMVTQVDEIEQQAHRVTFARIISDLRTAASSPTDLPVAAVDATEESTAVAGFAVEKYVAKIGRGYERELWVSERPLFHSDLYLLRLATDPVADDDLPALREIIELISRTGGYPMIDRSRMSFDGTDYTSERRLITVAEQLVLAEWFELPEWVAPQITTPPGGRPSSSSPRSDRSTREEESRPSDSDRTDP